MIKEGQTESLLPYQQIPRSKRRCSKNLVAILGITYQRNPCPVLRISSSLSDIYPGIVPTGCLVSSRQGIYCDHHRNQSISQSTNHLSVDSVAFPANPPIIHHTILRVQRGPDHPSSQDASTPSLLRVDTGRYRAFSPVALSRTAAPWPLLALPILLRRLRAHFPPVVELVVATTTTPFPSPTGATTNSCSWATIQSIPPPRFP